jgi:hypothetical protein
MEVPLVSAGSAYRPEPRPAGDGERWTYRIFGLTISSGLQLPGVAPLVAGGDHLVRLDMAERSEVDRAFSGAPSVRAQLTLGGAEIVEVLRGRRGDRLLLCGRHGAFYVGPGGDPVLCAPTDLQALGWQRVLLDTVLGTAALAHGYEGLHAGAIELDDGVVAIASPSGGGKSTLCAELVARGARLFADDLVFLGRQAGGVLAHPGPPLMTLPSGWSEDRRVPGILLGVEAGEEWIAVPGAGHEPAPLLAVLVLNRHRGATGARLDASGSPLELLTVAMHSVLEEDRQRTRFDLLAELAQQTPVRRLVADSGTPPEILAGLVESAAHDLANA